MKTAAYDLDCLDGIYRGQSNAINYYCASDTIIEGSINSIKVDYPILLKPKYDAGIKAAR